ncbi:MAG TPA: hypothetical protein VFT35_08350 [Gaiellaceae bacterium]|nr:hypothetical protein [Gaiellaceae bacterium]
MAEDFRVEVELDDEAHGYPLRERLRALSLDDEARDRLGTDVVVTRDGSRLFAYTSTEEQASEAERVIRELVRDEELTADIRVTRWHPVAEEWRDASQPLPTTPADEEREYAEREAAEEQEARAEGEFDWRVVAVLPSRDAAGDLARRLLDEGLPAKRRWHYVMVGVVTEERADELAERLRDELGDSVDVSVQADIGDVVAGPFQFIGF